MEEFELLRKLDRVKAPPGFEQRVMAQLSLRKRRLKERTRVFELSLAGGFAALVAGFVLLNIFVLKKETPTGVPAGGAKSYPSFEAEKGTESQWTVPIIETLDYETEIRSRSPEPKAVYLLEQVSERTLREIKY